MRVQNCWRECAHYLTKLTQPISAKPSHARKESDQHKVGANTKHKLVDKFGRVHNYLRISLTEKCNLRCQYCMPAEGVPLSERRDLLTADETVYLARLFVTRLGVNKIRLTGGEPLLQPKLPQIIEQLNGLRDLGLSSIGMTSNGVALHSKLALLHRNGLDKLNLSLDTLVEEKYTFITRRRGFKQVWKTIDEAIKLQMFPLKINCVVMRGLNEDEVLNFVELTRNYPIDVRFIEYMPFAGNKWSSAKLVPMSESLQLICQHFQDISRLKNEKTDTAKTFKVDNFCGSFGFISSMTNHFCSGCNRLRLTADGNLKVCLFDTNEVSLRDVIREQTTHVEDRLQQVVERAVKGKFFSHGGKSSQESVGKSSAENRSMILIGG